MSLPRHTRVFYELLRMGQHLRRGVGRLRTPSVKLNGKGRAEFYYATWRAAAAAISAEFVKLPNGFCEIHRDGCTTRIFQNIVKIDDPLIVKLVRVKPFVHKQLALHGIAVTPFAEFTLDEIATALEFLAKQDGPCVVKPADGDAAGNGVTTNVQRPRELRQAAINASLFSRDLLIERQVQGTEYRLLFLDGKLLDATQRRSPCVVGDGRSTIAQLIDIENRRRQQLSESASLSRIQIDSDCRSTLRRAGLSLRSIPSTGDEVTVKTAVNDNGAQDNISVRNLVSTALVEEVARATAILGIRLAGVDIITRDPGVSLTESGGAIIEVNSSPGLHHHYNVSNLKDTTPVAVPILRSLLGIENHLKE